MGARNEDGRADGDRGRSMQKAMGIYTRAYFTEIPYPQLTDQERHRASRMKTGKRQLRKGDRSFQRLEMILGSQGLFSAWLLAC